MQGNNCCKAISIASTVDIGMQACLNLTLRVQILIYKI